MRNILLLSVFLPMPMSAYAEPIKIAFVGDQGVGDNAQAVLSLIASENTNLLLLLGDLGYDVGAAMQWEQNINDQLGENFPVLAVVGNHENFQWPMYQALIQRRIDQNTNLVCSGTTGVKASCSFGNVDIVQIAPGVSEVDGVNPDDDYESYIRSEFSDSNSHWRICSWHKNQSAMQTGSKSNATGWGVYDACLDAGAMVAVAHEHAYSRSHLLSDFENQTVVHQNDDMTLEPGSSFAVVSGLGGREVRDQRRGGDWWASIYTASQGATHGALFCSFEDLTANCYFKAIDGSVPDQFTLRRGESSGSSTPSPTTTTPLVVAHNAESASDGGSLPLVFSRSDTDEYRWIDTDANGRVGSVWISKACALNLGGTDVSGRWSELMALAPGFDAIANPCNSGDSTGSSVTSSVEQSPAPLVLLPSSPAADGYVFSRTDKTEYRWISSNGSETVGSVWIDEECADRLGGASVYGRWSQLMALAPGLDAIVSPCSTETEVASTQRTENQAGFVFSRTDKTELRWIDFDQSGVLGSVWIDEACADKLGGAQQSGRWSELMATAPGLDTIASPCY